MTHSSESAEHQPAPPIHEPNSKSYLFRAGPPLQYSIIDFDADPHDPEGISTWVANWLNSPEMTELFSLFGHSIVATHLRDRLNEAEEITREIFDFRQGGERWEARKTEFDPRVTDVLEALIGRLYRDPVATPAAELGSVDHALVLGGRINSCILRGQLLSKLITEGLPVGTVWGLGSRRQAISDEQNVAEQLGVGPVADELDAMAAALRYSLHLPGHEAGRAASSEPSEVREVATKPIPVLGLAAAPGEGKPRATTSDTYRFFRETATLSGSDHVLIVTSAIHAPFQHAQAIAELGLLTSATITSVGAHIGTSSESCVRHTWTTAEWLQEVRSAIWSMRNMYQALTARYPTL